LRQAGYSPKPLPVILRPVPDELLSSWLARHAILYGIAPIHLLRHCLADHPAMPSVVDHGVTDEAANQLAFHLRCEPTDIRRMTHADIGTTATHLVSRKSIQKCETCRSKNHFPSQPAPELRIYRRGWRVTCPLCGSRLSAIETPTIGAVRTVPDPLDPIWDEALEGEHLLESYLTSDNETSIAALAVLRMLLVPRHGPFADDRRQRPKPRALDVLVPGFDEIIAHYELSGAWTPHVIVPLQVRPALLAGFLRLIEKPRPKFWTLYWAMVGAYRLRFETLAAKASPILGRLTFS
jgi:hypothetical protein